MKAILAATPPSAIAEASASACRAVCQLSEFLSAGVVMLYLPLPKELDPRQIVLSAWQADKIVLVPKVDWRHKRIIAMQCDSLTDNLAPGRYGILEPISGTTWPVEKIDFILTPGLAYDRNGNRLGRGAGLYDRFLSDKMRKAVACGAALAEQVVDSVPINKDDYPVDMLVTDREVIRFSR
jgi:5-formyltetrahydrofolate cyclo-ligase